MYLYTRVILVWLCFVSFCSVTFLRHVMYTRSIEAFYISHVTICIKFAIDH